MINKIYNYLFLVLLFVAVPCYGSDNNRSSWWFDGTWYPVGPGRALIKFSVATFAWGGGTDQFLYSLEEIPLFNFSIINANKPVILRATLKQKSRSGREGPFRESEAYFVIREWGSKESIILHMCPNLQQVQKDINEDTKGDYYCSRESFSREQDETDRDIEEKEKTLDNLKILLSSRFDQEQIDKFNQVQNEWKKDLRCTCDKEVGEGLGPGIIYHIHVCEKDEIERRLLLIRAIVEGQKSIDYREPGLKSCAEIRAEN